jgi:hypothetical protein
MIKGVEQMMQALSSLSLSDFFRSRLIQLLEQNFVGTVFMEENSLKYKNLNIIGQRKKIMRHHHGL